MTTDSTPTPRGAAPEGAKRTRPFRPAISFDPLPPSEQETAAYNLENGFSITTIETAAIVQLLRLYGWKEDESLQMFLHRTQDELARCHRQSADRLGGLAKCGIERDELRAALAHAVEALGDLLDTCRDSSWAHITNATPDDPCRCKSCSIKKASAALAECRKVGGGT